MLVSLVSSFSSVGVAVGGGRDLTAAACSTADVRNGWYGKRPGRLRRARRRTRRNADWAWRRCSRLRSTSILALALGRAALALALGRSFLATHQYIGHSTDRYDLYPFCGISFRFEVAALARFDGISSKKAPRVWCPSLLHERDRLRRRSASGSESQQDRQKRTCV